MGLPIYLWMKRETRMRRACPLSYIPNISMMSQGISLKHCWRTFLNKWDKRIKSHDDLRCKMWLNQNAVTGIILLQARLRTGFRCRSFCHKGHGRIKLNLLLSEAGFTAIGLEKDITWSYFSDTKTAIPILRYNLVRKKSNICTFCHIFMGPFPSDLHLNRFSNRFDI